MFKFFRKFAANKTSPIPERKLCYQDIKFPHYYATIIQLGWFGSPRYRKRLKKKLKKPWLILMEVKILMNLRIVIYKI